MNRRKKALRVLVVEDSDDQWQITQRAFRQVIPEAQVARVANEQEAVGFLNRCVVQEWDFPEFILLDLYLPQREDGWRVLEEVRALPAPLNRIPVVMLSSSDRPDDIREAYQHGCTSYLVKPTSYDEWLHYFTTLRNFWIDTATLPQLPFVL